RVGGGAAGGPRGPGCGRPHLDSPLGALPSRTFLMRNVHEDAPVLLQSRWALSYLAGPLTREQIRKLETPRAPAPAADAADAATTATAAAPNAASVAPAAARPP